ncbi:MAG: hypothetical protein QM737_22900 [Ferruginibacter sp.]
MKKNTTFVLLISCFFFVSCNTATPEKYFDEAVLNTNSLAGFGGDGALRQLQSPSAKLGNNGEVVAMKRTEELDQKIKFLEEDLKKIRSLKQTAETKEMLQTSLELYELALPVYKNEYTQLAKSFDEGASKESIKLQAEAIHDKYAARYDAVYNKLISIGKVYAEKNAIKVNWNVGA